MAETRHGDLARRWIDAWNSRNLDRILARYDDQAEMVSDGIVGVSANPAVGPGV